MCILKSPKTTLLHVLVLYMYVSIFGGRVRGIDIVLQNDECCFLVCLFFFYL